MPILITSIQYSTESPNQNNQAGKRNKMNPNWKGRGKITSYSDDMILYIENPKDSYQKVLELINSVNFQNTKSTYKNQFHLYILMMNHVKRNL